MNIRKVVLLAVSLLVLVTVCHGHASDAQKSQSKVVVVRFGIVTDIHYADIDPIETRYYSDGVKKLKKATHDIASAGSEFIVELGDFKDTDAWHHCDKRPSAYCTNLTVGYLKRIENVIHRRFDKRPVYHLFGNHDVDILNQTQVNIEERNGPIHNQSMWPGVYSWHSPRPGNSVRFIALNGDFTADGTPWQQLDFPPKGNNEKWNEANVPPEQISWLKTQLDEAEASSQRVIVFIHYRIDGGPDGPVGKGLGPPLDPKNRDWIDSCTLENAAVLRQTLEERHPGLVLAVFSGHDHKPNPPWTQRDRNKPIYFTHAAMVEGSWPGSNAYSVVSIDENCGINIQGYANATSAQFSFSNCTLSSLPSFSSEMDLTVKY